MRPRADLTSIKASRRTPRSPDRQASLERRRRQAMRVPRDAGDQAKGHPRRREGSTARTPACADKFNALVERAGEMGTNDLDLPDPWPLPALATPMMKSTTRTRRALTVANRPNLAGGAIRACIRRNKAQKHKTRHECGPVSRQSRGISSLGSPDNPKIEIVARAFRDLYQAHRPYEIVDGSGRDSWTQAS